MDPDANLVEQRSISNAVLRMLDTIPDGGKLIPIQRAVLCTYTARLADLTKALDEWIKGGGCLPKEWTR